MKLVILADLHCRVSGYDVVVDDLPERLYYPLMNIDKAAKYAKENDALFVIAGDLVHEHKNIHPLILSSLYAKLSEVSQMVDTVVIAGNHDYMIYNKQPVSWFPILHSIPNLTVVDPNEMYTDYDITFLSHGPIESMAEKLETIDTPFLISHFGLYEAKLSGTEYSAGDFSVSNLKRFKLVVLGHIHKPQRVSDNVLYVGSVMPISSAEYEEDKRFLYIDTDNLKNIKSVPTEYPKHSVINLQEEKIELEELEQRLVDENFKLICPKNHPLIKDLEKLKVKYPTRINLKIIEDMNTKTQIQESERLTKITISEIVEQALKLSKIPETYYPMVFAMAEKIQSGG